MLQKKYAFFVIEVLIERFEKVIEADVRVKKMTGCPPWIVAHSTRDKHPI
jgi:hypothetical protein